MSSSRVIKSSRLKEHNVSSVSYKGLGGCNSAEGANTETVGFLPLHLHGFADIKVAGDTDAAENSSQSVAPQLDAGMVAIHEIELQQKLEAAFKRGIDEGRQLAERGLANVFKSLREGIADITGLREKVLRESEDDLLKLSIMVAKKIIQQEIKHDPQILANIVTETISCCTELDRITLRLHPEDCTLVSANRHFYLSGVGQDTHVSLIPDETIIPGGCMVDTVTGTIDARIDVQLDEIYRRFLEERGIPGEPQLKLLSEENQHDNSTG